MEFHRSELRRTSSGQLLPVTMMGMVQYDESARRMVTDLKYHHQRSAAFDIACVMTEAFDVIDMPCVVTWIPTSDEHRLRRGFDHAELIARHVGAFVATSTKQLLRRTSTGHQTGQSRDARLKDVSFVASPMVRGVRVVVIDDVRTTGATFNAAIKAMAKMEPATVVCLSYAYVS